MWYSCIVALHVQASHLLPPLPSPNLVSSAMAILHSMPCSSLRLRSLAFHSANILHPVLSPCSCWACLRSSLLVLCFGRGSRHCTRRCRYCSKTRNEHVPPSSGNGPHPALDHVIDCISVFSGIGFYVASSAYDSRRSRCRPIHVANVFERLLLAA